MKTNLPNILTCTLITVFIIFFAGCASQRKMGSVPVKFKEELRIIGQPRDLELKRYSIKRGDTVWKVSKKFGVSPDTIVQINHIADVTDIKIGQTLLIPMSQRSQHQTAAVAPRIIKANLPASRDGFIWPVKNMVVSRFGDRKNGGKNTGLDIKTTLNEDVVAAKDGTVIVVSNNSDGWGKTIVIEHVRNMHTWYSYNAGILVYKGTKVRRGQVIAKAGHSGKAGVSNSESKLHFKIFVNDKPVNPLTYLPH
ncbi:MAG: peptidoglycan DD-metalloendopeptidase family protein [Candidatus Anammoxibacter sp.]